MVLLTTSLCVGQCAILLVESLDFVQVRLLGSGVGDTEATRSLEHQVLQIVSQTRSLCGVVLRTRTYCDVSLDTWFLVVNGEIYLQSVVEGVDACLQQVVIKRLILVVLC